MMPTIQGVRFLIAVPDLQDEQIQYLIDAGYPSDIDVAIALCDYMSSLAANSTDIKVGPISLSGSQSAEAWDKIKKDLILRKTLGVGVPGSGSGILVSVSPVVLTGIAPPVIRRGQFDNPPYTLEDD